MRAFRGSAIFLILSFALATPCRATDYLWTGSGADGNWSTTTNWSGSAAPTSAATTTITFVSNAGTYSPNNNVASPLTLKTLTFASVAPSLKVSGYGLTFNNASQSGGIYQYSANAEQVANAITWSGTGIMYLSSSGSGGLTLTNSVTMSGSNGTLAVNLGGVTYSGTMNTGTGGKLWVGQNGPTSLTLDGATTTVGGELDVNYQATRTNDTSRLTLKSGVLTVTGATYIGRAKMLGGASDYSAKVLQSGGTATYSGSFTIADAGTAKSLYDLTGGTLTANAGLIVGNLGNGQFNVSGSGSATINGNLTIGQDSSRATNGGVNVTGGTLNVTGAVTLGANGGVGSLNRSGGTLNINGGLNVNGAGTLYLDGTNGSVAAKFGGSFSRTGLGTLTVITYTGSIAGNEAISFVGTTPLANDMIGPWAVVRAGADSSGDYLKATGTGTVSLAKATYSSSNFASSTGTSLVNVTGTISMNQSLSAYAVKFGSSNTAPAKLTLGSGYTLTLASGGMILNGSTVTGGTVSFSSNPAFIYAGSSGTSVLGSSLNSSSGMTKFGDGVLALTGDNSGFSGTINVNAGVLNVQTATALGASGGGNGVTVASGASLELQGSLALGNKPLTLNGDGVNGGGALRNVSGASSSSGSVSLNSSALINTISGTLTLSGTIASKTYGLTKAGTGTLILAGNSGSTLDGAITVKEGTLFIQNSGALGATAATSGTLISSGATLALQGGISAAEPLTLAGTLRNVSDANTLGGSVTLTADAQVGVDTGALTLSGSIGGGYDLIKTGSGTLVLSNTTNTFGGALAVSDGTLSVASLNNAGVAGVLGLNAAPIVLGSGGKTGTFLYTGSSGASNRAFTITSAGTGVFQSDAAVTLSGAMDGSGLLYKTGVGTLTYTGSGNLFNGSTVIQAGVLTIDASGTSRGVLNASSFTINPGAALQITAAGTTVNQIADSANVILGGGAIRYVGNGTLSGGEDVGALVLNPGQNDVVVSRATGANTPYLRFASGPAAHLVGATVSFNGTNAQILFQANAPGTGDGNIIGGYAYYNNTDFATRSGTTGAYLIQAYSAYATGDLGAVTASSTMNFKTTAAQTSLTVSKTINSLNLTGSYGVTLSGAYSLTLNSGGIIANTTGSITGGSLMGSAGGELDVNAVQNITIGSAIANNGSATALVKTGVGNLTLTGVNTFTGSTFINQGTLTYSPTSALTYTGTISGVGALVKAGTATLTLTGSNLLTGVTTVQAGTLLVNGSFGANSPTMITGGALGGTGVLYGNVTATGGAIAMGSTGNIMGAVNVTGGTLTVGQSGLGNYLNCQGGVNVSGAAGITAATTASILSANLNYLSSSGGTFAGVIAGSGKTVTVNNASAVLTLSGSNTFTGVATVSTGKLKLGNAAALGTGGLYIGASGTVDLNGQATTTGTVVLSLLNGAAGAILTDSSTGTTPTKLKINLASGSANYQGLISDTTSHKINLVLSGAGTQTINAISLKGTVSVASNATLVVAQLVADTLVLGGSGEAASAAPQSVPEPGVLAILLVGSSAAGIFGYRRKTRRSS